MDLLNTFLQAANGQALQQMSGRLGASETQTRSALSQVIGVLGKGMARNTSSAGGLEGLVKALGSGGHARYLENPAALAQPDAIADGNGILGHLLGSKDVSRQVAQSVSGQTGMAPDLVKQLLPLAAAAMMGALSQKTAGGQSLAGSMQAGAGGGSPLGGLLGMLDADGDGSPVDDLIGMAGKFLR